MKVTASFCSLLFSSFLIATAAMAAPQPFSVQDLIMMDRVGAPVLSPDGEQLAFTVRRTDYEGNRGAISLWTVSTSGDTPTRRIDETLGASQAQWAADGKQLYFVAARDGQAQLWSLHAGWNAEPQPVSTLPAGLNSYALSPDGSAALLSISVFMDCPPENVLDCTRQRLDERAANPATGMLYDQMFVRHWSSWEDGRRAQLFIGTFDADGQLGNLQWLTPGLNADIPSRPFGGSEEFSFAPDGKSIFFGARLATASEPWSTDFDIYQLELKEGATPRNLTADNAAWDAYPLPSADGSKLYYLAMSVPGFEADRFAIMELDLHSGERREVAPEWDRSAGPLALSADGKTLYTSADDEGSHSLFAIDVASGQATVLLGNGSVASFDLAAGQLVAGHNDFQHPTDLYALHDGLWKQLTHFNRDALDAMQFGEEEWFWFQGWNDEPVHGYVIKPANYERGKRYPVAFLIHGGPQGAWGNNFHYRWNPQSYAGQGFAVVAINFHGSTGYGQAFTDAISQHWGDRPLEDLQKGWAAALEKYEFLDADRACALGASYGGYMVNWIAGNWNEPWKCLINHNGVFDTRNMYYATEELWFMEHEHGGPEFERQEAYERFNPIRHIANWRVPMLVIHSDHDYRIPLSEGLGAFTALQRQGIPSQLLRFPDETHWVAKPHNSALWHDTLIHWLKRWTEER